MRTIVRLTAVLAVLVGAASLLASTASARPGHPARPAAKIVKTKIAAEDDEVVLPSRVANAIRRGQNLLDAAGTSIDTGDPVSAAKQLKALQNAVARVDKAARKQMNAPADPNAEEGATTGPDSVIAALTFEQSAITTLAGYFDTKAGTVVDSLTHALFATLNVRGKLVDAVIALPAEGAGADFADGMADTLAGYDDEVANIAAALADDTLSAGGQKVLRAALVQSQATDAKINTAFGGGE
jgi:hypothetical protein